MQSRSFPTLYALSQNEIIPKQQALQEVATKSNEADCHLPMVGLNAEMKHKKPKTLPTAQNMGQNSMNCPCSSSCLRIAIPPNRADGDDVPVPVPGVVFHRGIAFSKRQGLRIKSDFLKKAAVASLGGVSRRRHREGVALDL
jgi:hypothetical protein